MTAYRDFPMPPALVGSARAWLADPTPPVAAKPSATVMLLRDASHGLEVFVLRRASSMPFAPDMLAFPGGGVDPRDGDPSVPWAGPRPEDWAELMALPVDRARELVIAAAREVFEECGVLLAGPDPERLLDGSGTDWSGERAGLLAREHSFGELLIRHQLVLRTDLMRLRARWTTPECEPRRYDTWFFAAGLPAGQLPDDASSEAAQVRWTTPARALADHAAGGEVMLPPTLVMIEQLSAHPDTATALAGQPPTPQVQPWPVEHSDATWMRAPIDESGHGSGWRQDQR